MEIFVHNQYLQRIWDNVVSKIKFCNSSLPNQEVQKKSINSVDWKTRMDGTIWSQIKDGLKLQRTFAGTAQPAASGQRLAGFKQIFYCLILHHHQSNMLCVWNTNSAECLLTRPVRPPHFLGQITGCKLGIDFNLQDHNLTPKTLLCLIFIKCHYEAYFRKELVTSTLWKRPLRFWS